MKKKRREAPQFLLFLLLAILAGGVFLLWGQSNAASTLYELGFLRYRAENQLAAVPEWALTEEETAALEPLREEAAAWASSLTPETGSFETVSAGRWFGEQSRLTLSYRRYAREEGKTVILLHGFEGTEEELLPWARRWWDRGWSVVIPEQRGYQDPGETNLVPTTWGVYEEFDLYDLILAAGLQEETVVVHGKGTGAAAALLMASNGELAAAGLDGLVAETPYDTLGGLERKLLKDLFKLGDFLVGRMLRTRIRDQLGFLPDSVDLTAAAANSSLPVLWVCGEQTTLPGMAEARALADARPEGTQLLSVPRLGYRALLLSEEYESAAAALFP